MQGNHNFYGKFNSNASKIAPNSKSNSDILNKEAFFQKNSSNVMDNYYELNGNNLSKAANNGNKLNSKNDFNSEYEQQRQPYSDISQQS